MAQLSRDEVHTYAEAMIAAIQTHEFQARVRAAMSREPIPADAEAVMVRYEEVQADYFTHHYRTDPGSNSSSVSAGAGSRGISGASVSAQTAQDAAEGLLQEVSDMSLHKTSDAPTLDGAHIVEQLKKAASVYKGAETLRLITQLCLLIEGQVTALPATVPALRHLYNNHMHGARTMAQAGGSHNVSPTANASAQVRGFLEMAMRTLNPKQRETLERVQQTMRSGRTPSPEDVRDMLLIQRHLGAVAKTMQKFGQTPSSNARGGGPDVK
ncbi:hypothetical protein GH5_07551 [Leishmania sp. Ghana 2012 LV757]|uniref:hypothetical protein n=1 Tax=Leishmania sp. Ghana 2012 LV757 TaxID=2803181 RepID=UPI001B6EA61D|nr:hypothetical protein GH5_07551 [Leishmania sp. Ghana 2012 LV757]